MASKRPALGIDGCETAVSAGSTGTAADRCTAVWVALTAVTTFEGAALARWRVLRQHVMDTGEALVFSSRATFAD